MEEINSDGSSRKAFHVKRGGEENVFNEIMGRGKKLLMKFLLSFLFTCFNGKIKGETFRSRA